MDSENNVTNNETKDTTIVERKPKGSKKGFLVGVICILVILVVVFGIFVFINSRPKNLFEKGINQLTNSLTFVNDEKIDIDTTKGVTNNGSVSFNVSSKMLTKDMLGDQYEAIKQIVDVLNKLQIKYDIKYLDGKFYLSLTPSVDNKDAMSLNYYLNGKNQYVFLDQIFDKYIELDELKSTNDNLKPDDVDYLYDVVKSSFINNMTDEYVSKTKSKITIDEKEINVKKTTFKADTKQLVSFMNNVLNDIKKDKRANEIITSFYSDFAKLEVKEDDIDAKEFSYSVYSKGLMNDVVASDLVVSSDEAVKLSFVEGSKSVMSLYTDDKLQSSLNIVKEKNNTKLEIFDSSNKSLGTIDIKQDDSKITATCNLNIEGAKFDMTVSTDTKKVENHKYSTKGSIKASLSFGGVAIGDITINLDDNTSQGATMDIDTSNSVKYDKLTDEELNTIQNKLMEAIVKILS